MTTPTIADTVVMACEWCGVLRPCKHFFPNDWLCEPCERLRNERLAELGAQRDETGLDPYKYA